MGGDFAIKYIKSYITRFTFAILLFIVCISILLCSSVAFAADVTLAWNASSGADGYRLFSRKEGQSYNYSSPDWEGTATTGTVTGLSQDTTYYFVVRACNEHGESGDSNEESTTIGSSNQPPVLDPIGSKSVDEGSLLSFTLTATDPDGDGLTFSASNVPTGASFNPSSRVFSWTPAFGDSGNYNVTFTVTDDGSPAESDSEVVTISVGNVNRPPVLGSIGSKSVDEGNRLTFTISASAPDGDILTYSASNLPSGANFNSGTRTFSWTPAIGDAGNYNVQFTVTDNGSPPESDLEIVTITVVDSSVGNLAPDQPVITSPYYSEMECDLLASIKAEPFSDPDGDTHSKSRWQIVKKQDSSVVLDITSSKNLTELPVPHTVLDRDTTYNVSVQFYDAYSEPSEWSDPVEFTTTSDIVDFDDDGIPDDREVDDTIDLNDDGIPDNNQPDEIKCVESAVARHVAICVSKISVSIDAIEALETISPSEILDKKNKPNKFVFGLASYRLRVKQLGGIAIVRIYYSEDIAGAKIFYMYDSINGWQDYTEHVIFNEDGRSVIVELKDGGYGDSDGVANGIIVDPGGVTTASVSTGGLLDSGAFKSGCFIATAAFGSYVEPHVKLLREFRDQYLLTNSPGRGFVKVYYKYGPFAADYIREHDWLKPIVRVLLIPLVGISYVLVRTSLATMILVGLLLIISAISFYTLIHRKRKCQA